MTPLSVPAGTAVVTQGDRGGDTFYVLRSGACDVLVDGKCVTQLAPGRAFGELALLYACPRAATVVSSEPAELWVLHQRWFRLVARSAEHLRLQQKVRARHARAACTRLRFSAPRAPATARAHPFAPHAGVPSRSHPSLHPCPSSLPSLPLPGGAAVQGEALPPAFPRAAGQGG
jgi:CRP-like cAMP-binding protein